MDFVGWVGAFTFISPFIVGVGFGLMVEVFTLLSPFVVFVGLVDLVVTVICLLLLWLQDMKHTLPHTRNNDPKSRCHQECFRNLNFRT